MLKWENYQFNLYIFIFVECYSHGYKVIYYLKVIYKDFLLSTCLCLLLGTKSWSSIKENVGMQLS